MDGWLEGRVYGSHMAVSVCVDLAYGPKEGCMDAECIDVYIYVLMYDYIYVLFVCRV